jgi:hypothetical protein
MHLMLRFGGLNGTDQILQVVAPTVFGDEGREHQKCTQDRKGATVFLRNLADIPCQPPKFTC